MDKLEELRRHYLSDEFEFAKYLNPHYLYGDIHERVFHDMQEGHEKLLLLLPRAHLKSHCVAVDTVFRITKDPTTTIVYLSAVETLAYVQIAAIKAMFESEEYRLLWPEMFHPEESKRDKWTTWAINVDHPLRKAHGIRDYSLIIRTNKGAATGLHCDHLVLDDIVIDENAYSEAGRSDVRRAVGKFVAIKNPGASTLAAGTRYHPSDVYGGFKEAVVPRFDPKGTLIGNFPDWKVVEYEVEKNGVFLWPKEKHPQTGKWYGFDQGVLASKKAEYDSLGEHAQFYAQYYNEPNDPTSLRIDRSNFQYYSAARLKEIGGTWTYAGKPLLVFSACDLAWTDRLATGAYRRDFTAIAVIGVCWEGFIYVLDLEQFQTDKYDVYFERIDQLACKWGFRKIRVESNSAGTIVARELQNRVRQNGRSLVIDAKAKTSHDGKKAERYAAVLEPRYRAGTILHLKGGYSSVLEDQVIMPRPRHDDLKDALTEAIEISRVPGKRSINQPRDNKVVVISDRFGGRRVSR